MADNFQWRPRSLEETIDPGVHPAVAAMRMSGMTNAPSLGLDALSRLGLTPASLHPTEKAPAIRSPVPERKGKKEKKPKEKKEKKHKKEKKKKAKESSSSSSSGSSGSSSSSKDKDKKKKKKKDKESKKEKKRTRESSEDGNKAAKPGKAVAASATGKGADAEVEVSSAEEIEDTLTKAPAKGAGSPGSEPRIEGLASSTAAAIPSGPSPASAASAAPAAADSGDAALVQGLERGDLSLLSKAVKLLASGEPDWQEAVAGALAGITVGSRDPDGSHKTAVAASGAIPPLILLLRAAEPGVQKQAARALHNLTSKNAENKTALIEAGALLPLLALLKVGAHTAQQHVVGVLRNLTGGSQENKAAVAASGAIPVFVKALRADRSTEVQANVAVMLYNLANNSPARNAQVAESGAVVPLVRALQADEPQVRKEAADALRVLAIGNAKFCMDAMGASIGPALAKILQASAPDEKRKAVLLRDALSKHGGAGVKAALASAKAL